ncbi:prion-inhibition and propagation-domain-containing protein [Aspergillus recurvatus]
MDPLGVGLGTAALLSTVLDVFALVTSFRSYSESSTILFCQLELEREVLLRWAIEVGLYPASASSSNCAIPPELLPLVHNTVAIIGSVLAKATSPNGAKKELEAGAQDLHQVLDRLQKETQPKHSQSRLSKSLTRLGWAISEETRLKDLIATIHAYNTSLHSLIPKPLQISLDGSVMQAIIAESDSNRLLEIQRAGVHWRKAISVAASVAALQQVSTPVPPSTNQLMLPRSRFASLGHDMARYQTQYVHNEVTEVLIEWRAYKIPPNSDTKTTYLNTCLDLARLLHASQNLETYRTLDCLGVLDDVEFQPHSRVGLVYRVPFAVTPAGPSTKAFTLHDLINRKEFARPSLDERFELARNLATALHRLFASRWYHKNLNSKNILFFTQAVDGRGSCIQPYLSGFDYARPDSPDEMTIKPEADEFCDRYRHPQCTHPDSRNTIPFRRQFDVYGLGILLMEIGRWETVDRMHKDYSAQKARAAAKGSVVAPVSLEGFQRYLRTRCVESLAFRMGTIYTNAVKFCLHGATEVEGDTPAVSAVDGEQELISRFNRDVVAELAKCTA